MDAEYRGRKLNGGFVLIEMPGNWFSVSLFKLEWSGINAIVGIAAHIKAIL